MRKSDHSETNNPGLTTAPKSPSPIAPYQQMMRTGSRGSLYGPTPSASVCPSPQPRQSPQVVCINERLSRRQGWGADDARVGPFSHQYPPPPPMGRIGQPNIFDEDTNAEAVTPFHNLNTAIPASISPLAEARFGSASAQRPSSAVVARSQAVVEHRCSPQVPRSSSFVALPRERTHQLSLYDNCGTIVEERDAVTNALIARYACGALLGTGGFAKVFEFVDVDKGACYACKMIDRSRLVASSDAKVKMEIDIHRRLRHPNVVQLYKTFQVENYYCILLERCRKQSLFELSKERGAFSEDEVRFILWQVCGALEYLHNHKIIHRDIKLGNVMIDSRGNMKLGDFGFGSELNYPKERKMRMCGTPNYIAPEVLECEETRRGYGFEADIWSLGVLLFALAFGYPPFETKDVQSTYRKIRQASFSFPSDSYVSESCKDLIKCMLQRNPLQRPTAVQVMRHPFLTQSSLPSIPSLGLQPSPEHKRCERRSPNIASPIQPQSPFSFTPYTQRDTHADGKHRLQGQAPPTDGVRKTLIEFMRDNDQDVESTGDSEGGRLPCERQCRRPPPPAACIQSAVFFSKYGYGFLLSLHDLQVVSLFLNDRTKLLYDGDHDTVFYYARHREAAAKGEPGFGRVAELTKTYYDSLYVFEDATTSLSLESRLFTPENQHQAAAQKKFSIAKFLSPHLHRGVHGTQLPFLKCSFKNDQYRSSRKLFSPSHCSSEMVYVKEATMNRLADLVEGANAVNMLFMAARFSNQSYQVSVHCSSGCPGSMAPCTETCIFSRDSSWVLDILIYSGHHALVGVETEHTRCYHTFMDIRSDTTNLPEGRTFLAAGSTSTSTQLTIPRGLLGPIAESLRRVRTLSSVVECFS